MITRESAVMQAPREGIAGAPALQIFPESPRAFFWKAVDGALRPTFCSPGGLRSRLPASFATGCDIVSDFHPSDSSPAERSRWFSEEVHSHDPSLRAYLRGSFPAVRDVDDVVQESYLRIWKAAATQRIQCARAFLFRVARNVALNLVHHERASPIKAVQDLAALPVVEDKRGVAESTCAQEELLLLARAIDSLPARCREIIILRRIQNVPQKEIAARLGISEATVETQVARGVKRCGEYLRKHGVRFES